MLNVDLVNVDNENNDALLTGENTLIYYVKKILQRDPGFTDTDLTENDAKDFMLLVKTLQDLGFFVPASETLNLLELKEKLLFIKSILSLFLNIFPHHIAEKPNIKKLYKDIKEYNDNIMLSFIKYQPLHAIKNYLIEKEVQEQ